MHTLNIQPVNAYRRFGALRGSSLKQRPVLREIRPEAAACFMHKSLSMTHHNASSYQSGFDISSSWPSTFSGTGTSEEKSRMPCVNCGEKHVRMRKATNEMVYEGEIRTVPVAAFGFCLTAICLACIGVLLNDFLVAAGGNFFIIGATTAGSITVVQLLCGRFFSAFPFKYSEKKHYKCSKCGYAWDD
jgi:hypothetical protein